MSKETPTLAASTRERTGSRYARRLRAAGQLPAVLYGHGMDPISIAINEIEIIRHLTEGAHVFELDIEGRKETCLVKDIKAVASPETVVCHIVFKAEEEEEESTAVESDAGAAEDGEAGKAKSDGSEG
jgi:ribosomal protein L25 (general stress protein Ctc)